MLRLKLTLVTLFFYLTTFCKLKETNEITEPFETTPGTEGESPESLGLTQELLEGEIVAVPGLSALAVASVIVASKSLDRGPFLGTFKSSGTNEAMANFHSLPGDQKRLILEENVKRLQALRARMGNKEPIKVLVVGASGGNGHKSAGDSMKKVLNSVPGGDKLFKVEYVDPWPFNVDGWNTAMKNQDGKALSKMVGMQGLAEYILNNPVGRRYVANKMQATLANPDIVVQAEHIGSGALSKISDELGAQHRLVPTDFQIDHFVQGMSSTNDSMKFRIDTAVDLSENAELLAKRKIRGAVAVGYPVRWELLDMAEKLRSENPDVRRLANSHVDEIIGGLVETSKADQEILDPKWLQQNSEPFKKGDKSVLVMMGGQATNEDTMKKYLKSVIDSVNEISTGEKVHLFMAQTISDKDPGMANAIHKYYAELLNDIDLGPKAKKIAIHTKKFLGPGDVGALMHKGVTITKSGGGTLAELATMGGTAVFDTKLSKWIDWEKFGYEYFQKKGWGFAMKEDFSDIGSQVTNAFRQKTAMRKSAPKNTFHLDWPQKVLADLITTEQQKLIAKYGSDADLLKGPAWSGVDDDRFAKKSFLKANDSVTVSNKIIGGTAAIVAMSAAGLAIWQAIPDEYKKEEFRKKKKISEADLKLTSSHSYSCFYKIVNQFDFCLTGSDIDHIESMKVNCKMISNSEWFDSGHCGELSYSRTCQLDHLNMEISFNTLDVECKQLVGILEKI